MSELIVGIDYATKSDFNSVAVLDGNTVVAGFIGSDADVVIRLLNELQQERDDYKEALDKCTYQLKWIYKTLHHGTTGYDSDTNDMSLAIEIGEDTINEALNKYKGN